MTLANSLSSFDDNALVALANKGLLRRAHKACKEGEAEITRVDEAGAEVKASGHTVTLPVTGPQNAACSCPASGVCSHILMAVIALRSIKEEPSSDSATPPALSSRQMLLEITESALRKFAGVDYEQALVLAGSAEVDDAQANLSASFATPEAQVTFVAGQPLSTALYKGPSTRKRLVITAAAIAVRFKAGVSSKPETDDAPSVSGPEADMLQAICEAIETAIDQVFHGSASLASERFLDLAISARVQSAPRLTSQLMTLSAFADWADKGDIRFDDARFLSSLSQAYALSKALTFRPNDPTLCGVARRSYDPAPALSLWALGAGGWATAAGARGLTLHFLDSESGQYFRGVVARGAGQDPFFTASGAFRSPIWGIPEAESLPGTRVHFPHPLLSSDHQLSTSGQAGLEVRGALQVSDLTGSPHLIRNWDELRSSLHARAGVGLSRVASPLPSLILPDRVDEAWFDDINQLYNWPAWDAEGKAIQLSAPPSQLTHLKTLPRHFPGALALLITTTLTADGPIHEPVSILVRKGNDVEAINLHFTKTPAGNFLSKARVGFTKQLRRLSGTSDITQAASLGQAALTQLAEHCRHPKPEVLQTLAKRAEAQNLILISDALHQVSRDRHEDRVLKASYLCSEACAMDL